MKVRDMGRLMQRSSATVERVAMGQNGKAHRLAPVKARQQTGLVGLHCGPVMKP